MGSIVHSGAVAPYGLSATLTSEDIDLTTATAGRFRVVFADGAEASFEAILSDKTTASAVLGYSWQAGDLAGRQGVARYYPEIDTPSGALVGNPRSFRIRDPHDM